MKKIYRKNIELVESLLFDILYQGEHADKWVAQVVKERPDLGGKDRRFVQNSTYDIVRYWLRYSHGCNTEQPEAIIHYALSKYLVEQEYSFPEGYDLPLLVEDIDLPISIVESIPTTLYDFGKAQLGVDKWHKILKILNEPKPLSIRVNMAFYSAKKLETVLKKQNIVFEQVCDTCFALKDKPRITQWDIYKNGSIEIQDWGSQQIIEDWVFNENDFVLDLCAGAGGKLLQMASLAGEQHIHFLATDVVAWKLKNLAFRARKAKVRHLEVKQIKPFQKDKSLKEESFDKILIDAPCSGSGVWGRFPDAKYKLKVNDIEELNKTQLKLLHTYSPCLKVGGELIYATCSVFPSENNQIVDAFLMKEKGFEFIQDKWIAPTALNDGFYSARLKRTR